MVCNLPSKQIGNFYFDMENDKWRRTREIKGSHNKYVADVTNFKGEFDEKFQD